MKTFNQKPTSLNNNKLRARRERVLALLDSGKTADEVARKMTISVAAVAAYAAHRTMGTY